jgi:hypothetical protein
VVQKTLEIQQGQNLTRAIEHARSLLEEQLVSNKGKPDDYTIWETKKLIKALDPFKQTEWSKRLYKTVTDEINHEDLKRV